MEEIREIREITVFETVRLCERFGLELEIVAGKVTNVLIKQKITPQPTKAIEVISK